MSICTIVSNIDKVWLFVNLVSILHLFLGNLLKRQIL